jgi:hypothetical protein
MNKFKGLKLIIGLVILFLVLITAGVYPLLTQETNTLSVLNGIIKLNIKNLDTFEYDADSTSKQYITKSKDGFEAISNMLQLEGWVFKEQFGSGFLFEYSTDEKQKITIGSIQFSRYYRLWKIPQTSN